MIISDAAVTPQLCFLAEILRCSRYLVEDVRVRCVSVAPLRLFTCETLVKPGCAGRFRAPQGAIFCIFCDLSLWPLNWPHLVDASSAGHDGAQLQRLSQLCGRPREPPPDFDACLPGL